MTGVVAINKNGVLTVITPSGIFSLTENASRRHGHHVPNVGEEVVLTLDGNNAIIDAHLKDDTEDHTFYSGKLV